MPKCAAARRSTAEKGAVRCRAENVRTVCAALGRFGGAAGPGGFCRVAAVARVQRRGPCGAAGAEMQQTAACCR